MMWGDKQEKKRKRKKEEVGCMHWSLPIQTCNFALTRGGDGISKGTVLGFAKDK